MSEKLGGKLIDKDILMQLLTNHFFGNWNEHPIVDFQCYFHKYKHF